MSNRDLDDMLARMSQRNLERIRASCEADGDHELAELISAKLVVEFKPFPAETPLASS